MKVKVAVLQYEIPENSDDAFKKLEEMVVQAAWSGARLIVAPETAVGEIAKVKERDSDYLPELKKLTSDNKVFLVTSYYKKIQGKFFNQGYVLGPDGSSIVSYQKIYLAKPEVEDDGITSGENIHMEKSSIGRLSMLICKDGFNRYSHFLYEKLGELGAEIICIPSWSLTWKEMDTQEYIKSLFTYGSFISRAYVLVAGNLNKSTGSFGRSLIISPIRGVLKEGSIEHKEILSEELDLDEVKKARDFDSWWQPKKRII